jgi:4-amino-4-deoxy-L-arabinose transferase-like glycosyltransferase
MQQQKSTITSFHFGVMLIVALMANALGLFNDILEPDGALYASIAKNIVVKKDWINLFAYGGDWLDKPHFPFWLSAFSFKVFGINSFAYKLPSFLCFLLGVFYTYKLSFKLYSKEVAQFATLIYATSLHVILCNFDVRAEGYLTAFIVAAIYHFYCATQSPWFKHIVAAALYAAFAIMTKGIFVLITITAGFVVYWLMTKQWTEFIKPKWYLFIILCFVFITPELYCLYHQFDLHPEKIVFGRTNVSGIKFFFWDSQFGRFFNTGPIQGDGDVFFFVHTTLWAFLPWAVYLFVVIVNKIRHIKQFKISTNIIVSASAFISFLMFSVSKFQLPHYVVILFPLFSIMVANYLIESSFSLKQLKLLQQVQHFVFVTLIAFITLVILVYKIDACVLPVVATIIISVYFLFLVKDISVTGVVKKAFCFSVLLAIFLNLTFYKDLMKYQAGMKAGKWQQKNMPTTTIAMYKCNVFSFDFYGNSFLERHTDLKPLFNNTKEALIFTPQQEIKNLNQDSFKVKVLESFPYYHITEIKPTFFNAATRATTLDTFVIAKVEMNW